MQAERLRVADEDAQDAPTAGKIADRSTRFLVQPRRDEPLERPPAGVDDAQSRVPGTREARRRLDEALEEHVERELRAEGDARFDELLETVAVASHGRTVVAGNPRRESGGFPIVTSGPAG